MSSKLKIDTRVRSLKNYLEEFEQGAFQIPSFQRDFLWSQDDIKQLFDSIKNNYPIGSILFWKPLENASAWIDESKIGPYKIDVSSTKDPIYILDGYQRLSSLFGCLTNPKKYNIENIILNKTEWEKKFNLYYDLEDEQFVYLRSSVNVFPHQLPVYVFMNSIDFRQYARKNFESINDEKKIELYYDRADEIGQIFTNYQIASVDINYATIEEAVEIFWRVNAKGVIISKDWIVSALTLKDDFRLGSEIDKLLDELRQFNFERIKRDVIFQCIQSSFGKIYFDYKIEDLVKRDDFSKVAIKTFQSIKKAVKFLYEDLLVLNSKLIPYNAQLIFLTVFFNSFEDDNLSENTILKLKKWFWITSYSNYFTIYSLSNQRKAFEKFIESFLDDSNLDPVYYDNENLEFTTLDFPSKISMGSVRSKSLALFMINYSKGFDKISTSKINSEEIENFEFGYLFSKSQRDNPSENFIPIIEERIIKNDGVFQFTSFSKIKRPKNYSFLLNEERTKMFINSQMIEEYKKTEDSEQKVLEIRKELIIEAEKEFVKNLGINYTDDLLFAW
jgi:hypothetical protein